MGISIRGQIKLDQTIVALGYSVDRNRAGKEADAAEKEVLESLRSEEISAEEP